MDALLSEVAAAGVVLGLSDGPPPPPLAVPALARALAAARDPETLLQLAHAVRRMLSVAPSPPIDAVLAAGALPRLVELLSLDAQPRLLFEALWALTNIASGTSEHARAVIDAGALPACARLLASPDPDVRGQAVWALGNVAGDCVAARDAVLATPGALSQLLAAITPAAPPALLKNATWALSNLCRGEPPPPLRIIRQLLPKLAELITSEDKDVQQDALWALSCLSDGGEDQLLACMEAGALPRVVQLLASPYLEVVTPALRICGNLVKGDDLTTQAVLNEGLLFAAPTLLASHRYSVRKEACWMLSNVCAGTHSQVQAVLDANVLPQLMQLAAAAPEAAVRREAGWALSNFTASGSESHVYDLVRLGALPAMAMALEAGLDNERLCTVLVEGLENILRKPVPRGRPGAHGLPPHGYYLGLMEAAGVPRATNSAADVCDAAAAFMERWFPQWEDDGEVLPDPRAPVDALVIERLAPSGRAARLASCTTCWLAAARACACAEKCHECAICQDPGNEGAGPWTALGCGHLFHERCILRWAAHASRGARAVARRTGAMPSFTAAHCPLDRKCITCVVRGDAERAEYLRVVDLVDE